MGSFAGNRCTPSGLSCTTGSDINFSDGELADVGGSWGIAAGKGSVTVAAEYRHHNRTNRASFDPRDQIVAGDAGTQRGRRAESPLGRSRHARLMTFVNASVPLNASGTQFF